MGCLIMGCVSSKNQIKTTEVHNTKTGDQITLLAKCMTFNDENIDINLCQHDVMIKLSGTETYDNHRLNSAEIYKWFEKRNHEIPSHFQECKQVLDQYDEYKQKQEKEEKEKKEKQINPNKRKTSLITKISVNTNKIKKQVSKKFVIAVNGTPISHANKTNKM
eukprot:374854_1